MNTTESMGRRQCVGGDEYDHLTPSHHMLVENHGVRGKVKTRRNRRVRRQVNTELRNYREES